VIRFGQKSMVELAMMKRMLSHQPPMEIFLSQGEQALLVGLEIMIFT
jgi:hypothetical protein